MFNFKKLFFLEPVILETRVPRYVDELSELEEYYSRRREIARSAYGYSTIIILEGEDPCFDFEMYAIDEEFKEKRMELKSKYNIE